MNIGSAFINTLSKLDSTTSLVPMAVKDVADVGGRTYMAYNEGGKVEAIGKGGEELGTSVVWLGGIPLFRWILDKTMFKAMGLDPNIDLNKIKKKGPQQLTEEGLKKLTNYKGPAEGLFKKYKKANNIKTGLAIGTSFVIITKAIPAIYQAIERHIVISDAKRAKAAKPASQEIYNNSKLSSTGRENQLKSENLKQLKEKFDKNIEKSDALGLSGNKNNKVGFSGVLGSLAKNIGKGLTNLSAESQTNPLSDMIFVDLGISGNRVAFVARNPQERIEYAIKEGGIIFFFFQAAGLIKKRFEKLANKVNAPIDLDFKVLGSKTFKNRMQEIAKSSTPENIEKLTKFADKGIKGTLEHQSLGFIRQNLNNPEFFTIEAAKKSGIIKTVDGKLDPKKYIHTDEIKKLSGNIEKFAKTMMKSGLNPEQFINRVKGVKAFAVLANLAICNLALGYGVPKLQYLVREKVFGSKEYPGARAYHEEAKKILAANRQGE